MADNSKRLFVGADHAGIDLKNDLIAHISAKGWEVVDLGAYSASSCDYPDFAQAVCREVLKHNAMGLLICGTGIGMSISANRVPGIRAALCTHEFHARASRAHNNANVLCLGARITASGMACVLADAFLGAPFEGGRHQRRLDLIDPSTV